MLKRHLMKPQYGAWLVMCAALSFGLGACSSSKKSDDGEASSEEIPDLEAGTDAVPVGDLEQIEGDLDGAGQMAGNDGLTLPVETPPAETAQAPVEDPLANPAATDTAQAETPQFEAAPMAEAPVADPAPVAQSGEWGGGGEENYTVQAGDTLMKIAFETYGDLYQWKKIFEMNRDKLSDPNAVPPGVSLKLEKPMSPVAIDRNGEKYLIRSGDTLGTISDDIYGTKAKWRKLWENNRQMIKDPNRIFAGFYLYYTMTPEEREEADQLKQQRGLTPPPLAGAPETPAAEVAAPAMIDPAVPGEEREPAAVTGG